VSVPDLAAELADTLLSAEPFLGTGLGMREYDALLPDPSVEAEEALASRLADISGRAGSEEPATSAERVTQASILAFCSRWRDVLASRAEEFAVSAMPFTGPPMLLATAARTVLPDPQAAEDYLTRLRGMAAWLDGTTERLRGAEARGRLPVGVLTDQAITWLDRTLAEEVPSAFTAPQPREDWDGPAAWASSVRDVVRDQIVPALGRWRDEIVALRPACRDEDAVGFSSIPGGDEDYQRLVRYHTTLPLTAEEIHQVGLETVGALEAEAVRLGRSLGLTNLPAVVEAVRASSAGVDPLEAMAAAQAAVRRAEERAVEVMPAPLPGPCAVEPMPQTVAESGMAPHYTRPRLDGSRPGTYWFNTMRATAGAGWDLEAVAFHEAVPGHHLQLARLQLLPELPLIQQLSTTVHSEGWGLYAEDLAGEFGLYSDERAQLGAVYAQLLRAVRLVVDTGIHAFGWSRQRAIDYAVEHVALPEGFLVNEVDRYILVPGQALAYLTGKREIVRLREWASAQLGDRFDLPTFHSAVLDSGSVAMPVLDTIVRDWVASLS
jgi:uncharacterized protein (DUF885 family)